MPCDLVVEAGPVFTKEADHNRLVYATGVDLAIAAARRAPPKAVCFRYSVTKGKILIAGFRKILI